jgi:hypothetical protein
MANNTVLNLGSGGDTLRDLDRSGVKTPIVALDLNPAGAETLMAGAMPVSGTVTVNAGTNLNTSALALESGGHLAAIDGKVPALGQALAAASVPVVLTAAQLATLTPVATVTANQGGTWNVGTVTTVTTVSALTAITNALPAGTNLLGKVSSGLDTSVINNGTTALTPKFAAISTAASGVSTVVAAVASKKIRVLSYRFQADADVSVKFRDNTAAVDLTGAVATGAKGGGGGASFSPVGHFETAAGNALSISLSGAVQVSGHLTYVEV